MTTASSFDSLSGADGPTEMFGECLGESQTQSGVQALADLSKQARTRVEQSFEQVIEPTLSGVSKLDRIIQGMWESEWAPNNASFNLFCTDFGALYAETFLSVSSLSPVFRSPSILNHMSFWQPGSRQEFFPFHKIAKALSSEHGESLAQMFKVAQQSAQSMAHPKGRAF